LTRFERLAQSRETNRIDTADAENSNSGLQEPLLSFTPNTEEVKNVAHNLATSIFSDWSQLQVVIEHYEGTLRKRWENKTEGAKSNILLKAWPGMSFSHRPDFHAFVNENFGQKVQGVAKFKDAYMWQQINLEDLTMAGIYCFTLILGTSSTTNLCPCGLGSMRSGAPQRLNFTKPALKILYNVS
jgi:hypothetical protein